ncbi:MAG: hypothetical protein EXQ81_00845 [Thermoleophilia bacterium]|nr:hypothetical protein [Thermoleophilia bacterium]
MRPAFYALRRGGWRDYVTVLHLPYTAWHLSYVVVGGCLATEVGWGRLGLTVLAFFLAMGVGAHALDERAGRPLGTTIPSSVLAAIAVGSVLAACGIGVAVALRFSLWILPLVAIGAFLVPAYNLELFGGRFHTDIWFAVSWGAFPVVTGYVACQGAPRLVALAAAGWATTLSLAQRRLSTPVRRVRRDVVGISGEMDLADGGREQVTRELLVTAPESALRLLSVATFLIAATLVWFRL